MCADCWEIGKPKAPARKSNQDGQIKDGQVKDGQVKDGRIKGESTIFRRGSARGEAANSPLAALSEVSGG